MSTHPHAADTTDWLIRVFQDLHSALTIEEALHVILEQTREALDYQTLAILLIDDGTDALALKGSRGLSYSFVKTCQRTMRGPWMLRAILQHETVRQNNVTPAEPNYATIKLEHDFGAVCLVPILYHQRAIGYLHCDRAPGGSFDDADAHRLRLIGCLIGLMIEKFELLMLTRHLARTDEVSKALKYHAFLEEFQRERARAKAYRSALSLLLVDLDDYTQFLKTCGIPAGYALLEQVHTLMRGCVRDIDFIGRFSADEFIVCLGGMNRQEAFATLDQIRQAVAEKAAPTSGCRITLCGVALTFERPEDLNVPFERVLSALGAGLIAAQAQGRNQVVSAEFP